VLIKAPVGHVDRGFLFLELVCNEFRFARKRGPIQRSGLRFMSAVSILESNRRIAILSHRDVYRVEREPNHHKVAQLGRAND
jgi:hypothetical protein